MNKEIFDNMKKQRIKSGWGLREIARHLVVAPQTVIRWEKLNRGQGEKFRSYLNIIGYRGDNNAQ